jgi:hypothetical protein
MSKKRSKGKLEERNRKEEGRKNTWARAEKHWLIGEFFLPDCAWIDHWKNWRQPPCLSMLLFVCRREMAVGVMQRLEDLNTVLGQTNDHRHRVLAAASKNIKVAEHGGRFSSHRRTVGGSLWTVLIEITSIYVSIH